MCHFNAGGCQSGGTVHGYDSLRRASGYAGFIHQTFTRSYKFKKSTISIFEKKVIKISEMIHLALFTKPVSFCMAEIR